MSITLFAEVEYEILNKVNAYYRVYVREGKTEVQVQDWTELNRTPIVITLCLTLTIKYLMSILLI